MSITISTCQEICKSPTNNSTSKMLYSFSKSSRFPQRRRILCDKFYQHPSSVSPSRTTTFGFGNKYQFTKDVPVTPPPNTYCVRSQFQYSKTKGFGFGEGRSQMQVTGPLVETIRNKNPGPGTYQLPSTLAKITYSLMGRNCKQDKQKKLIPGPGSYPITFCINKNGTYFLTKYKNSLARNFSKLPGRLGRSSTAQRLVPGPGAYDTSKQSMSPDGRYITSKIHNSLVRRFGLSARSHLNSKNQNPGPGNYKLPSQFGHYMCKDFVKINQRNVDNQNNNKHQDKNKQKSNKQNQGVSK